MNTPWRWREGTSRLALPLAIFIGSFSWSFVFVSLPFHIQHIRFLQVLFIAPVFPIAVGGIAHRAGGQAIGAINAARIGAGFIGPVLATTVLAVAPPAVLYLLLAAVALASVPVASWRRPVPGDIR